jgi:hypothetical protein
MVALPTGATESDKVGSYTGKIIYILRPTILAVSRDTASRTYQSLRHIGGAALTFFGGLEMSKRAGILGVHVPRSPIRLAIQTQQS